MKIKKAPEFNIYSGEIEDFPIDEYDYKGFSFLPKKFRIKRWRFIGIFSPEIVMGIAVVNMAYLGSAFVYGYDRKTGKIIEFNGKQPLAKDCNITDNLISGKAEFLQRDNKISINWDLKEGIERINLSVQTKKENITAEINLFEALKSHIPHQTVFPTFKDNIAFTHKLAGINAAGKIKIGNKNFDLNKENSFAVIDHTIGYHDYNWRWEWASLSCLSESNEIIGLNLVSPITDKRINENALWFENRKLPIGEAVFEYNKDNIMDEWSIKDKNGIVDLIFTPLEKRAETINIGIIKSKFSQPIGLYNGVIKIPNGKEYIIKDKIGLAEEHFARW